VADKLDTLVGCLGIGLVPTGSQDPYGLRRLGLGLIRILIDTAFAKLFLGSLVDQAIALYKEKLTQPARKLKLEVMGFLTQRMDSYLRTQAASLSGDPAAAWFSGEFRGDLADAVLSHSLENPLDTFQRFLALVQFNKSSEFEPLLLTFKRATRIIPSGFSGTIDTGMFKEEEESVLYHAYQQASQQISSLIPQKRYTEILAELDRLRHPLDRFFDRVLVMDENRQVRENRLAILKAINNTFHQFADFSRIVVASGPSG
jgi:glycyl-tRNA synthetase beta chain